jgi:hypothetical protein
MGTASFAFLNLKYRTDDQINQADALLAARKEGIWKEKAPPTRFHKSAQR